MMPSVRRTIQLPAAQSKTVPIEKAYEQHLGWMKENCPDEAEKLNSLKVKDPNAYKEQLKLSFDKYKNIERASRVNPAWAETLKEELKTDEQIKKTLADIKSAADDSQKQKLTGELKVLIGKKVDIDAKQKQIEHEQMVKRLAKLQEQIKVDEAELKKQEAADVRDGRIDTIMKDLLDSAQK